MLPPIAGLDFSMVFSKGFKGTTLLDTNLAASYDQFLTSLEGYPAGGLRHYLWVDFMKSGLKGSELSDTILNTEDGNRSIVQVARDCYCMSLVDVFSLCK